MWDSRRSAGPVAGQCGNATTRGGQGSCSSARVHVPLRGDEYPVGHLPPGPCGQRSVQAFASSCEAGSSPFRSRRGQYRHERIGELPSKIRSLNGQDHPGNARQLPCSARDLMSCLPYGNLSLSRAASALAGAGFPGPPYRILGGAPVPAPTVQRAESPPISPCGTRLLDLAWTA